MNTFITIFFLFVRIISNPIANVFQKTLSNNCSSFVINFYTYFILSLFCIPFLFKFFDSSILNINFLILVIIAGLLCAMGTVCLIKAVNIGELSIIGPINSYKSIVGLLAAFVLLKEIPSFIALFGMLLIILGSKFIFETTKDGFSLSLFKRKDIQLRFLALILTGIEAAILKQIIIISSVEICFIFWCFTGLFWSFVFMIFLKKKFKINEKKELYTFSLIAICLGLMQYSTNFVFERMNVGYALALFQLSSIITVIFGYKIFKECNIIKKLLGSCIMIIGSIMIILN